MDVTARNYHLQRLFDSSPRDFCVLLVHPDVKLLAAAGEELARTNGYPQLDVAAVLSAALATASPLWRSDRVLPSLQEAARHPQPEQAPLIMAAVDLLFEPSLQLDPLAVMRHLRRVRPLAVLWPGSYADGVLCYAVPEHSHYRHWPKPDLGSGRIIAL